MEVILESINIPFNCLCFSTLLMAVVFFLKSKRDNNSLKNKIYQQMLITIDTIIFIFYQIFIGGKEFCGIFKIFLFFESLRSSSNFLLQNYLRFYFISFRILARMLKIAKEMSFYNIFNISDSEHFLIWALYYILSSDSQGQGYHKSKFLINVLYFVINN